MTRICDDEYVSCTSADEAQDFVQMCLKAWKQAGCETPSHLISASQPVKELHSSRAGGSQPAAAGTSLPTKARNRELTVLWSQPPPNIPLPTSAHCSPKPFPAVGSGTHRLLHVTGMGASPQGFPGSHPKSLRLREGKAKPCDPGGRSEQPGQHQGKAQLMLCPCSGISEQLLRNKTRLPSFRCSLLNS